MFFDVPATGNLYSEAYGPGGVIVSRVNPQALPQADNGFGLSGAPAGLGFGWGDLFSDWSRAGATIITGRYSQPELSVGTSIQRQRNPDGSYSEVLSRQPEGVPVGLGAPVVAAGVSITTVALLVGGGLVLVLLMNRGR